MTSRSTGRHALSSTTRPRRSTSSRVAGRRALARPAATPPVTPVPVPPAGVAPLPAAALPAAALPAASASAGRARRATRSPLGSPAFSALALTFAGGIIIATSFPALAVTATDVEHRASVYTPVEDRLALAPQDVTVAPEAAVSSVASASEQYAATAAPPPLESSVAGLGSVTLIETARIVWPVVDPTRISDGFGYRSAPCAGCSTAHDGIDFNAGNGTPIMSIADGVVISATESGGGFGAYVEVQHNIEGELITSLYAHMQYGSIGVSVGDEVTAGQQLGLLGSTGQSTGPHLHLEMYGADGVRFDGLAWLQARVTG